MPAKQQFSEDYQISYSPLKWAKQDSCYYQAAILIPQLGLTDPYFCYQVGIEKLAAGKWQVFGTEHEPAEFEQSFDTLKGAKEYLQNWALHYIWCELKIAEG